MHAGTPSSNSNGGIGVVPLAVVKHEFSLHLLVLTGLQVPREEFDGV